MKLTGRYIDKNYNRTNLIYTFSNGSYIEFFSVEDEAKLRGARRNILYVNEANNIDYESYKQLAIRTSGDIYIDFNPTSNFWAHSEVLNEPDSEFLKLTYKHNEGLPQTIIDELEQNRIKALTSDYFKNWCRVYLDGEVGQLEGTIIQNWKSIDNIPEDAQLLGYGSDWGFTNDPTTLIALYKWEGKIIADELIYIKGLMSSDYANLVKQNNIIDKIIADSAEPRTIAELKTYGINIQGVKKPRIKESIHLMLEYELLVTSKSTNLINEITHYKWSDKANGEPIDAFNHCIDALRYIIWTKLGKNENKAVTPFRFIR
jgi:phage terminase large subunit